MGDRSRYDSTDTESIHYEKEDDLLSECDSVQQEDNFRKNRFSASYDKGVKVPSKSTVTDAYSKEENSRERFHLLSLDAYSRHKKFINDYLTYYGGSKDVFKRDSSKDKTDKDILREHHQFLWEEDEEEEETLKSSWGKRLAKKYYDKLFREYCIADLSLYKKNKIAMRWRVEKEVMSGKGQFVCGEKRCRSEEGLRSWEVNFAYMEHNERKNALVKLRLCPDCSYKLNYRHKKKDVTKKVKKRKRSMDEEEAESSKKAKTGDENEKEPEEEEKDEEETTKRGGENVWNQERVIEKEKSKEEEFEEYFEDIFL